MMPTFARILHLRHLCGIVMLAAFSGGLLAQPAPNFSFTDPDTGRSHTLSDFRGEVVYLDFWASWCGPCRQSFPFMNELHARYKDQGLRILAVNVDETRADAQRFLDRFPADFQIIYDHQAALPPIYGVEGMPTAYFIDHRGQIQYEKIGFRLSDRAATEQRLIDMMKAAGTF